MRRALALIAALGLIGLWPTPAQAVTAGWISSTCLSHEAPDDPLVHPGEPGASHLHAFVGGLTTDAFSTPETVRAGGTCSGTPGDSVAEWVPALSTSARGALVPSAGQDRDVLTYYRNPCGVRCAVTPFPDGFGVIFGNAAATSPADNPAIASGNLFWKCGPGGAVHLASPPSSCTPPSFLVEVFTLPQYADQAIAYPPTEQLSHMSYTHDAAHPVVFPRLQIFVRYSGATGQIGTVSLSSGEWFTAHVDYWNTWDQAAFDELVARCINANVDCGKDPA